MAARHLARRQQRTADPIIQLSLDVWIPFACYYTSDCLARFASRSQVGRLAPRQGPLAEAKHEQAHDPDSQLGITSIRVRPMMRVTTLISD